MSAVFASEQECYGQLDDRRVLQHAPNSELDRYSLRRFSLNPPLCNTLLNLLSFNLSTTACTGMH
jgi:hypothetical protein